MPVMAVLAQSELSALRFLEWIKQAEVQRRGR